MEEFKIKFRGVRGSYPVPSADYLKYGGNTACVEVRVGGHLIILDAGNTDNLSGLDFCKKLREQTAFSSTKIIVTSIIHDKELILNSGADLYLPKPFELSHLVKWVKNFMDEVNF